MQERENDPPPLMAEWHRFVRDVLVPEGIAKENSGKFLMAFMGGATTVIGLIGEQPTIEAQVAMFKTIIDECDAFSDAVATLHERYKGGLH